MNKPTIVIHIDGGLVQAIYTNQPIDVDVIVADYDVEGIRECLDVYEDPDGEEMYKSEQVITVLPEYVNAVIAMGGNP